MEREAQCENQVAALMRKHEEELRDIKNQMEQDELDLRTQHEQEMDELRDLLSREVSANAVGSRTRKASDGVGRGASRKPNAKDANTLTRWSIR